MSRTRWIAPQTFRQCGSSITYGVNSPYCTLRERQRAFTEGMVVLPNAMDVDQFLIVATAGSLGILTLVVMRGFPKAVVWFWALVIGFVPIWIGVTLGPYFPAATLVSLFGVACLVRARAGVRWAVADTVLVAVAILAVLERILHLTTLDATFTLITAWAVAYTFGRLVAGVLSPQWTYGAIAAVFTVVAALAIIEYLTGSNIFVERFATGSQLFEIWGPLQPRGDVTRVEGAFGHSIALGASMGIGISFALGSELRSSIRIAMVITMAAASVLTFSRTGMMTCILALVLAAVFQRQGMSPRLRGALLTMTVVGGFLAFGLVRAAFTVSGAEAEDSANYRARLFDLLSGIRPFGVSTDFAVSLTGQASIGEFRSIDNALLLFGLTFGWVPLLLVVGLLATAVVHVFRGIATPAVIAVVAQIPAFVTVALITQYAYVVWFTVGLAVGSQLLVGPRVPTIARAGSRRPEPAHAWTGIERGTQKL